MKAFTNTISLSQYNTYFEDVQWVYKWMINKLIKYQDLSLKKNSEPPKKNRTHDLPDTLGMPN